MKVKLNSIDDVQNFDFEVKSVAQIKKMRGVQAFQNNSHVREDVISPALRVLPEPDGAEAKRDLMITLDPSLTSKNAQDAALANVQVVEVVPEKSKKATLFLLAVGLLAILMGGN